MKIITPQTETWQNIKFIYMLWGPIPHHLLCPLSSPYFHYFSPLPCPTTPPLPLPTSTFTPTTLLSPFNYHQSASITHPPLNYNAPATPPSLLINYHYHMFSLMVTNNNITLSPSLIYQFSLHVGVTAPSQYNSCNCHYNIADITLLPPPQCISNLIT